MTSSARASSVGGTSRPSSLAVLRLITNLYLVGAWTGRSAGFSPLRMRSTYPAAPRNCSTTSYPYESGRCCQRMAGRAQNRVAAGAVLPRGVHAAGSAARHRLPERGGDLRPAVQGLGRDYA